MNNGAYLSEEHTDESQESKLDLPASKYIVLIGDGMGDYPLESLKGRTALEAARTPFMDMLAETGEIGRVLTVPKGMSPGSDVANMSILGYDPKKFYTGRGPLEAAAMGIKMNPEDVAFRCNLVTLSFKEGRVYMEDYSAGHISNEEAAILIRDLAPLVSGRSFELFPGVGYRHILLWKGGPEGLDTVPPHDFTGLDITEPWHVYEEEPLLYEILKKAITFFHRHPVNEKRKAEGKLPANSLWPWGQGRHTVIATMKQLYGIKAAVVAAVDLIKGLGVCAGMDIIKVPGATAYLDTNYAGKAAAALEALKDHDLVVVHVEAPDEAGHMGSAKEKVKAIERFDKEVVGNIVSGLKHIDGSHRILLITDHYTPVTLRTHSKEPVPFVIFDSANPKNNEGALFNEKSAAQSSIYIEDGFTLMERFIGVTPREVDLTPKKKFYLPQKSNQEKKG